MRSFLDAIGPPVIAITLVLAWAFWAFGYHIIWPPTEDQLYGCTVAQQAPNGEC